MTLIGKSPTHKAKAAGSALAGLTLATALLASAVPAKAVSVAKVGTSVTVATLGANLSLDFYYQPFGSSTITMETVAGARTTWSSPSLTQVGQSSVIAALGANHTLDFYYQPIGGRTWYPETVAGPGTPNPTLTYFGPSIVADGNESVIAAQGPNGTLWVYRQPVGGTGWTAQEVATSGVFAISSTSLALVGNSLVIAATSPLGNVDFYWEANGTTTWHPEQVSAAHTSFGPPSVTQVGNYSMIATTGPNLTLDLYRQAIGAIPWTEIVVPGATVDLPPAIGYAGAFDYASPEAVVTAMGPNHTLQVTRYTVDGRVLFTQCLNNVCTPVAYSTAGYSRMTSTIFAYAIEGPNRSLMVNDDAAKPGVADAWYTPAGNGTTFG